MDVACSNDFCPVSRAPRGKENTVEIKAKGIPQSSSKMQPRCSRTDAKWLQNCSLEASGRLLSPGRTSEPSQEAPKSRPEASGAEQQIHCDLPGGSLGELPSEISFHFGNSWGDFWASYWPLVLKS